MYTENIKYLTDTKYSFAREFRVKKYIANRSYVVGNKQWLLVQKWFVNLKKTNFHSEILFCSSKYHENIRIQFKTLGGNVQSFVLSCIQLLWLLMAMFILRRIGINLPICLYSFDSGVSFNVSIQIVSANVLKRIFCIILQRSNLEITK